MQLWKQSSLANWPVVNFFLIIRSSFLAFYISGFQKKEIFIYWKRFKCRMISIVFWRVYKLSQQDHVYQHKWKIIAVMTTNISRLKTNTKLNISYKYNKYISFLWTYIHRLHTDDTNIAMKESRTYFVDTDIYTTSGYQIYMIICTIWNYFDERKQGYNYR